MQDCEEHLNRQDTSETDLDEIWTDEAEERLKAYREGRLSSVSIEEIFGPNNVN